MLSGMVPELATEGRDPAGAEIDKRPCYGALGVSAMLSMIPNAFLSIEITYIVADCYSRSTLF